MSFYTVLNNLTASIVNAKAVAADTNTRSFTVSESVTDSTTYDLVASKAFKGTGSVVVDTALMETPYGNKAFASVHGIAVSVVSGSVEVVQPATLVPLTGAPSFAASTTLGPGMYYLSADPATVSATARNIEFNATAANFTVVVFGVEGVVIAPPLVDPDAQAYVDELDTLAGTSLEIPVRAAIDDLVVGLKADGLLASIEHCYLFCGPKTMSGTLMSLKSPAISFDDLNESGVEPFSDLNLDRVNGVATRTGYVQSLFTPGLATDAMTTSNAHIAAYVTDAGTQGFYPWSSSTDSAYFMCEWNGTSTASFRLGSGSTFADTALTTAQLLGAARQSTTALETITGTGTTNSHSDTATAIAAQAIGVVGARGGQGGATYSDSRIAFASYGDYLDLAALRSRVNTYVAAIAASGSRDDLDAKLQLLLDDSLPGVDHGHAD